MNNHSDLITPYLPENLESLNKRELEIRTKSILQINSEPALRDHLDIIHTSMDMIMGLTGYESKTDEESTIQYLGARLFNSIATSLGLVLRGYYQVSFMLLRDILEIGFLLDYFSIDRSKIIEWKNCPDNERYKKFSPVKIREALDKRDGFQGQKRREAYQIMCEYAAHPTYTGFQLLSSKGLMNIGPFFEPNYIRASLEDLAKFVPHFVVIYIQHFDVKRFTIPYLKADMDFIDKIKIWSKKYFQIDLSHFDTDEIRKLIRQMENP